MLTVNEEQVELMQRLLNNDVNNDGEDKYTSDDPDYFKNLQFLMVVGVEPRDLEPLSCFAHGN